MDGEDDDKAQEQGKQGADDGAQDGKEPQAAPQVGATGTAEPDGLDEWRQAVAERDIEIEKLNAQIADAAKSVESAEALSAEIEKLRADALREREEFELRLAGVRSVRAGRALLAEHNGDVAALKEAEPWLFGDKDKTKEKKTGATGLPSNGAATDEGRDVKRWRSIAGLDEE